MRVYHLNCTTIHGTIRFPGVTHCLLIETEDGLILVDTGFGVNDHVNPSSHIRLFKAINNIGDNLFETAVHQLGGLGYQPEDVRHIVLTHLHLDHAGGISDFPWAKVHVHKPELEAAMKPRWFSAMERVGYVAAHWAHGPKWVIHSLEGEKWFDLDCMPVIDEADCQVLLVPLVGHSRGLCGVGVRTQNGWLLHCGDAFVRDMQVHPTDPQSPFPRWLNLFERRLFPPQPIARLRKLRRHHGDQVKMFCSHDAAEFSKLRNDG